MPITISGSGSITGLSSGAGVAATALSGQVPDANAPSGSVIQVVEASTTTQTSSTSTTFADTALSGSITPLSTSSRIAVMWTGSCLVGVDSEMQLQFLRNGSAITSSYKMSNTAGNTWGSMTGIIVDSPSSTSAVTYKLQIRRVNGNNVVYFNTGDNPPSAQMILMEIA